MKTLLIKRFSMFACDHHVLEYPIVAWTAPPFMTDAALGCFSGFGRFVESGGSLSSAESLQ